jgi:hypothetical protein
VHKAKTTQEWLQNHVPEFISSEHWLSASQWSVQDGVIKAGTGRSMDNFPMDIIHTAIDE